MKGLFATEPIPQAMGMPGKALWMDWIFRVRVSLETSQRQSNPVRSVLPAER